MNDYRLCADCGKEFLDETIDSRRAVCTVCEAVATDTDQYRAWREQAERSRRWKRTRVTGERNGQRRLMDARDSQRKTADTARTLADEETSERDISPAH